MLYLVGLMGLLAAGTTVMLGDEEEDVTPDETGNSEDAEASPEEITDLGSLIPDDPEEPGEGSDETDVQVGTGTPVDPDPQADTDADGTADTGADGTGSETGTQPGTESGTDVETSQPGEDSTAGSTGPNDDANVADEGWSIQTGGATGETINGTDANEFIIGYDGDDQLNGNGGTDQIEGGDGDDTLSGGADNDELDGNFGDDHLMGDDGDDTLAGHSGDDLLQGGDGDDSMIGGQGDDTLEGGEGDDALHGYHGDDVMRGGEGEDTLFGSLGDDVLDGLSETGEDDCEVDYLNGGEGDDLITAGANDIVTAGDGADTIQFGEWNTEGGPAEVLDFEAEQDTLVVLYDEGTEEPDIEVEQDAQNSELYSIMADGELIAQVHSATPLTPANVSLVAENAA